MPLGVPPFFSMLPTVPEWLLVIADGICYALITLYEYSPFGHARIIRDRDTARAEVNELTKLLQNMSNVNDALRHGTEILPRSADGSCHCEICGVRVGEAAPRYSVMCGECAFGHNAPPEG